MLIENHIPNRQKDEKLILFIRRHWVIMFYRWFFDLLFAAIPIGIFYFLYYLQPQLLSNQFIYAFLLLLASIYYLFILLFFFNAFIDFYLDVWIVTNQRIINIEQKGLFNREIAEHGLDKIQDVSGEQKGLMQTFFSYGNVHVQTAGEIQRFVFKQVDNPFEIVRIINHLIQGKNATFETQLKEKLSPTE